MPYFCLPVTKAFLMRSTFKSQLISSTEKTKLNKKRINAQFVWQETVPNREIFKLHSDKRNEWEIIFHRSRKDEKKTEQRENGNRRIFRLYTQEKKKTRKSRGVKKMKEKKRTFY